MAGHNYLSDPTNPFFSLEDDIDDETFLNSAPSRYSSASNYPSTSHYSRFDSELEQKRQQLLQRRKEIEDRTLQSSARSISTLRETEDVGISTAEELIRQREQLERTERRLDDINNTLRFSQKHIQGIKSVFGGLKNYFSSKSMDQSNLPSTSAMSSDMPGPSSSSSSHLEEHLNRTTDESRADGTEHPVFRYRGVPDEDQHKNFTSARNIAEVLEQNLDEMSGSILRLKDLAIGLSEEIDTQNEIIDVITDKAEKADLSINRQNKDIRYLLKK